jgi:hypothetical protein
MKPTTRAVSLSLLTWLAPVLVSVAYGQQGLRGPIPRSASVFIDPMDGFGPELQRAFVNDKVHLVIASDRGDADFEIMGGIRNATDQTQEGQSYGERSNDDEQAYARTRLVTVTIVNLRTKSVAWGYGASGFLDLPDAAESCAKSLKQAMEGKRLTTRSATFRSSRPFAAWASPWHGHQFGEG